MGTRGFIGFLAEGELKIAYNHFDSYPGGIGLNILEWLRTADHFEAKNQAVRLRVVQSEERPTRQEVEKMTELGLYTPRTDAMPDWYWLLRETQGDPAKMLQAGVIEDASNFPYDSLFCEWGYLLDFDEKILEVYKGFQTKKPTWGRFIEYPEGSKPRAGIASEYWPVNMVRVYDFELLPENAEFVAQMEDSE